MTDFHIIAEDGSVKTGKTWRSPSGSAYIFGTDGQQVWLPRLERTERANLLTDVVRMETRANFLRAALDVFDDEVAEADAKERERDEELALKLSAAFTGSERDSFDELSYRFDWMRVAQAARRAIAAEAADE